MNDKFSPTEYINYRRNKAFDTLSEIQYLLNNNLLANAMNRIYYSGFYIVSALLLLDNFSTSKHKQLIGYFNKEYVKTNKVDRNIGRILEESYQNRIAADYHDFVTLTKSEIENYYTRMKLFIEEVNKLIDEKLC